MPLVLEYELDVNNRRAGEKILSSQRAKSRENSRDEEKFSLDGNTTTMNNTPQTRGPATTTRTNRITRTTGASMAVKTFGTVGTTGPARIIQDSQEN